VVDLTAVEVPASVVDIRSNNYEDYVDLDSVQSDTLDWAYHAAKEGKITINRRELQEFLVIFEATLGFFLLTIDGVKRYFFVYIENGLETSDIMCLKLLRVESPTTTEIGIKMSYSAITDEEWKEMFMDRPLATIPPSRPDKFNFLPIMPELSENELDDIRERQENAGLFGMRLPISTDSGFTMKDCVIHKGCQWFVYTDESLTTKLTPMISIVLPTPPA
jgi:hypothetical protein